MAEFYNHLVDVSKSTANKLKSGANGMIKKIGLGINLHVNQHNHEKLMAAYKKGKGCKIKLSPEEIAQNDSTEGSGFFQTLSKIKLGVSKKQFTGGLKTAAKTAAKIIAPVAKEILPQLGSQAGIAASIGLEQPALAGVFSKLGESGGKEASNQLTKYAGSGFRPVGGSGLLDNINPVGYGSQILPVNHPVYWDKPFLFKPKY